MRSRHRASTRWGKEDALDRTLKSMRNVDSDIIVISRSVMDVLRFYRGNSLNQAMGLILKEVKDGIGSLGRSYNKRVILKIPGVKVRLTAHVSRRARAAHSGQESSFLVVIKVDESYVGYRIDDFENMIASKAVDDILSEN